jgi:flagellar protein FliO/FliZ
MKSLLILALGLAISLAAYAAPTPATTEAASPTAVTQGAPSAAPPAAAPSTQSPQPAPASEQAAPQAQAPAAAPMPVQPAPQASFPGPAAPSTGSLLQTLLALCFVLALLAALAWFVKRFNPRAAGGAGHLRVVSTLSLGGRERIMVVEVADQWIVVGASPGRVNVLSTMPRQEGVEPPAVLGANVPSAFADWLKQTIEKRNAK